MIYYGCPKCGNAMSSPDSMADKFETCPDCGNVAAVPSQPAPQPALPTTIEVKLPARKSASGAGVASLVLGILAILGSWVPFYNLVSLILGFIGLLLSLVGFSAARRSQTVGKGITIAGAVLCVVAVAISLLIFGIFCRMARPPSYY